ncbi:MAG: hypothetical protein LBK77_01640 [Spirochaetaceae bacterium]|nr:hypothetical protein [Spirochaetaceae bacterium]
MRERKREYDEFLYAMERLSEAGRGYIQYMAESLLVYQNSPGSSNTAADAQGIEAEILLCRPAVQKIGAESPVSGAERRKCAQNEEPRRQGRVKTQPEAVELERLN